MPDQQQNLFDPDPAPWELDAAEDRLVASVVIPDAPGGPYDYFVADSMREQIEPGRRVEVPFGRGNRAAVGYCVDTGGPAPQGRKLKEIKRVVDTQTLLTPAMLRLTRWMADYYLCRWGYALQTVLPAGVRGKAGTREVTLLSVPTHVAARLATLDIKGKQAIALKHLAASPRPLTPAQLASAVGSTSAPITALRKKGLVEAVRKRVFQSELEGNNVDRESHHELNDDQRQALAPIVAALEGARHETFLMHGVTGSGKTEVYIRAIEHAVSFGRQAIVLVPEISLTPQTVARFRARFDTVAVLHSHLSDAERHQYWQQIAGGEVQVVVGARSAIFAPTPQLGLIVLDEEHENTFKQDQSPRYHARDVADFRAQTEKIPLVLGSATPSLESWRRAQGGEYRLLSMPRRIYDRTMPAVGTIDLRGEFQSRRSRGAVSRQLHQAVAEALRDDGQVILLLNRRGFSTHIQCPSCGAAVSCPDCDITLTYHRDGERALCHICDYDTEAPDKCPDCNFDGLHYRGLGTQRLEQEIRARFPDVPCLRMDTDTMRKAGAHEAALAKFREGEVKILLGTQMIAKGLDFPNVTLVGVVNADTALHLPDFRAAERTFQLVTQVAGRTGRSEKGGRVLVQTFSPEHPAIQAATRHDYVAFAKHELAVRQKFNYPPFTSLVRLIVRSEQEQAAEQFARELAGRIGTQLDASPDQPHKILGPSPAPVAKFQGKHRFHMLIAAIDSDYLRAAVAAGTEGIRCPDDVQWVIDVDPTDMM